MTRIKTTIEAELKGADYTTAWLRELTLAVERAEGSLLSVFLFEEEEKVNVAPFPPQTHIHPVPR